MKLLFYCSYSKSASVIQIFMDNQPENLYYKMCATTTTHVLT